MKFFQNRKKIFEPTTKKRVEVAPDFGNYVDI